MNEQPHGTVVLSSLPTRRFISLRRASVLPSAAITSCRTSHCWDSCDVDENARAAELIANSDVAHRAAPNVRAVLEASQRAFLLATARDYDLEGSKAWVYSLVCDRSLMGLPRLIRNPGVPANPEAWFFRTLNEMAGAWEAVAPGKGRLLRKALERLPQKQGRSADSWIGRSLHTAMRDRVNRLLTDRNRRALGDIGRSYAAAYAGLSRQTHPKCANRTSCNTDGSEHRDYPG
jgi:hypothetical protein